MARRTPATPLKLAFLVEGDADKAFVEALVPRIVGPLAELRTVRIGSKVAFASTYIEAAQFVEAEYAAVFVLLDADTELPEAIKRQKQQLMEVYRRYGLEDRVRIHFAVPMLEAWLLAAYRDHPEQSTQPKRELHRFIGSKAGEGIRALAAELPIDLARKRARSFDEFVADLEAFAPALPARIVAPAIRGPRGRRAS
jgi:hypothetical protein